MRSSLKRIGSGSSFGMSLMRTSMPSSASAFMTSHRNRRPSAETGRYAVLPPSLVDTHSTWSRKSNSSSKLRSP